MSDCLFCSIIAGTIPSKKVYEDDLCLAFYDIDSPGPHPFFSDSQIPHQLLRKDFPLGKFDLVAHIFEVISKVTKELGLTDFRVVSNCGERAGQSVHHLHFHILAGRDMTWPPG